MRMNNAMNNATQATRSTVPPTRAFAVGKWTALMCDFGIDGGAPSISTLDDDGNCWTVSFVDLDLGIAITLDGDSDDPTEALEIFPIGAARWSRAAVDAAIAKFNADNCAIPDVADLRLAVDQMAAEKGWW